MTRKAQMPAVNLEKLTAALTAEELDIVTRFIKADGSIRASKPTVERMVVNTEVIHTEYGDYLDKKYDCADPQQGKAAYTWRHVVFAVSPKREHHCIPTLDFCDLPDEITNDGYMMTNPKLAALHRLADKVIDCVNIKEWHGVRRWGNALGTIGTPQVRENGSIVYR
jgi:hypothetical protein